jgi:small subunit ribosomal protein S20
LANSAQARKRARQAEGSRKRNTGQRSMLRTYIKNVLKAIESGDAAAARTAYEKAVPVLDKSVGKGLIHKNKAARHKSRLGHHVRALQS